MTSLPHDWPRISSSVFYDDAPAAIDWLCRAFGFEVRLRIDGVGGRVEHSELTYEGGVVMVGTAGIRAEGPHPLPCVSPRAVDGRITQALFLYVDDVDAHAAHAAAHGAEIVQPLATHDYGDEYWVDRGYRARDPEGHHWWFSQRLRGGRVG